MHQYLDFSFVAMYPEREKFLVRIAGNDIAPEVSAQLAELAAKGHVVPHVEVPKHISRHVMPHFASVEGGLDLVILGGTRVIRGPILDFPKHGVLNSHPGLLPDCRGSASPVSERRSIMLALQDLLQTLSVAVPLVLLFAFHNQVRFAPYCHAK